MKIVGEYKNTEIRLTDLHLGETYGGSLMLPVGPGIEIVNGKIINRKVYDEVGCIFGEGRPVYIYDKDNLDYKEYFPGIMAIAWLSCSKPVKREDCDGSNLVLVFFQDSGENPLTAVAERLKKVNWEKHAEDFEF